MTNCKHCGIKLIIKHTNRKASQLTQQYYFSAYYFCPRCHRMYHDEKFKVMNPITASLFTHHIGSSDFPADIDIWTDGACANNGNSKAKAAWAFVSGNFEKAGLVKGKQTNNTAEALAIYFALEWAIEQGYKRINIHSDSQITINNLQKTLEQVKANREIFKEIFDLIDENHLEVQYTKVAGHSGEVNNERVDKLANGLVSL